MTNSKKGRPRKASDEEILKVFWDYYLFVKQNAKDLKFAKISAYAKQHGYAYEAYDFQRSGSVREAMIKIQVEEDCTSGINTSLPQSYVPLDIDNLLLHGKPAIHQILLDREDYFRRMAEAATIATTMYSTITAQLERTRVSLSFEKSENAKLLAEIESLQNSINNIQQKATYYYQRCKTYLPEELAVELSKQNGQVKTSLQDIINPDLEIQKSAVTSLEDILKNMNIP